MLNHFVDTGVWNKNIVAENFQYDRWLQSNPGQATIDFPTKQHLLDTLNRFVVKTVEKFLKEELDVKTMLFDRKRQFNQLRACLAKNRRCGDLIFKSVPSLLKKLDNRLRRYST